MYLREKYRRPENAHPRTADATSGYRFLNPGLGRWCGRDPAEQDGPNLYTAFRNGSLNALDATGLKTKSCGGGLRLRVAIASLDAFHPGQPYADVTSAKVQVRNAEMAQPQSGLLGVQIPALQSSGEDIQKNAQNTKGIAYWLFFVDFDVCPDKVNAIGVTIEETLVSYEECVFPANGGPCTWTPVPGLQLQPVNYPVGPQTQVYGTVLAKRNSPVSGCTHTAIVADIARIPQRFVATAQNAKVFRRFTIEQTVKLVEYPAGSLWPAPPAFGGATATEIDSLQHTFSLGVNMNGTVYATP